MFKFIIIFIIIAVGGSILFLNKANPANYAKNEIISNKNTNIPKIREEDIIRTFFNLINENQAEKAIAMMTSEMKGDETSEQAWLEQFKSISFIEVKDIIPSDQDSWTDNKHKYQVTINAIVAPTKEDLAIPFYGWGENPNIRWVTITKINNLWQISELATGF